MTNELPTAEEMGYSGTDGRPLWETDWHCAAMTDRWLPTPQELASLEAEARRQAESARQEEAAARRQAEAVVERLRRELEELRRRAGR